MLRSHALGHHFLAKTRRPDCSRPFPRKPLQSVTSWPHAKRGGSLAARTRYVLPSNRLLPSAMIVKFSFSGVVSEAPPAQTAPSNCHLVLGRCASCTVRRCRAGALDRST